jgi:hypothetical protein
MNAHGKGPERGRDTRAIDVWETEGGAPVPAPESG